MEIGPSGGLNAWLKRLPSDTYDLTCRGLRTIRNIEAHLRPGSLKVRGTEPGFSIFGTGADPGQTLPWCFAKLTEGELPKTSHLEVSELPAWQALVESTLAASLMHEGVHRLTLTKPIERKGWCSTSVTRSRVCRRSWATASRVMRKAS